MEDHGSLVSTESRSKALVLANVATEDVEDVLPCRAGQLYHLASWLKSDRKMCEATWTYQCSKRLNLDDLRSAWRRRHSMIRTIFVALSPEKAVQVVLRPRALNDDSFACIEDLSKSHDTVMVHIKRET